MPKRRYSPEQKALLIRQAETLIAGGRSRYAAEKFLGLNPGTLGAWGVETPIPPKARVSRKGLPAQRYTKGQKKFIIDQWNKYVPAQEIAEALGKSHDCVRMQIRFLGLKGRDQQVLAAAKKAPPHIKRALYERGEQEFMRLYTHWLELQSRTPTELKKEKIRTRLIGRDFSHLSRNDAIRTKREMGVTLQELGDEYGVTRERIRQICNQPMGTPSGKRGRRRLYNDEQRKERKRDYQRRYLARKKAGDLQRQYTSAWVAFQEAVSQ